MSAGIWVAIVWVVLAVVGLVFNHGAHRHPHPPLRVLYALPDLEEEDVSDVTDNDLSGGPA